MNPLKKLLHHTAVYGLSSILGRFLNYLLVPIYTAVLVPHEYGVVTELYAYVGFLMVFLTFGLETGFFRFANGDSNWKTLYTSLQLFLVSISSVFLVAVILARDLIANWLGYQGQEHFIVFLAVIVALDAVTALPFARLRFENKAARFATIRLINIGVNISANLVLILLLPYLFTHGISILDTFTTPKVDAAFWSNALASLVALALLIPHIFDVKYVFSSSVFKRVFVYSFPLLLMGLAGMINETFDRAILKYLITVPADIAKPNEYVMHQLGVYGANYKLSILMTLFIQAFRYAAEPFFFARAKEKGAKTLYASVMNYFVAFGLFIFLGILLYLDVVKYFINTSYHEGLGVAPVLLLANLFLGIVYNLSIWYKLSDKTKIGMWIGFVGAAVTIVLNVLLVPSFGYMGAAYTTLFCYLGMALASYLLSRHFYPIPYNWKRIALLFGIALALYSITFVSEAWSGVLRYTAHTVALLVYLGFVAVIFRNDYKKISA